MITTLRQVDEAFQKKISGCKIGDKEVPVYYIDPEGEFTPEVYPAMAVFRSGAYQDFNRYSNDTFEFDVVLNSEGNKQSSKRSPNPEPYNVYYSIRLYYNYQSDGTDMNTFVMRTLNRTAYLPIDGDKYDVGFVSYKNPNATYREFGVIKENKEREFIDQYLFKVEMNLDTGIVEELKYLKPESEGGGIVINPSIMVRNK